MINSLSRRLVAGAVVAVGVAVSSGVATAEPGRGDLLSVTLISSLSREQVVGLLEPTAIDTRVVTHGVDAYRVEYRTIDPRGRRTTASGTVVLPRTGDRTLPTVAFQHGTIVAKNEAASVGPDTNRVAPITFASAGNAVVAADYLGLGTGPGTHPYLHLPSETTASTDMLRAADTFVRREGHRLDRRVLVTGFSQGGPSAMALGRDLQREGRLGAIAGVSGLYDLFDTQFRDALDGLVVPELATISSAYYLTAMNRLFGIFGTPSTAFLPHYREIVEDLFDGTHSGGEIAEKLPDTPKELLTDDAIRMLKDPTPLLRRTTDGSCLGWAPRAPVRLYAATGGDELVTAGNSTHCRDAFATRGVEVPLIEVGRVDHNASAQLSYPLIIDFFAEIGG